MRWTRRPLSVRCRPGTSSYNLQAKIRRRACIHALPRAMRLRTLPPYLGRRRHYHVHHGTRPLLPAREGSGAATCRMASDPTSLFRNAPMLSHVTWLRTPPPSSGGLRCYHMPHDFEPRLPAREGSSAVTCPVTLGGPRALRIKKVIAATACSKARGFLRHVCALPRRM
jgi:hypothetical protein